MRLASSPFVGFQNNFLHIKSVQDVLPRSKFIIFHRIVQAKKKPNYLEQRRSANAAANIKPNFQANDGRAQENEIKRTENKQNKLNMSRAKVKGSFEIEK